MVDVDKLDNIILDLENSTENIKELATTIKKVKRTSEQLENNTEILKELTKTIQTISVQTKGLSEEVEKVLKSIQNQNDENKSHNVKIINAMNTGFIEIKNENVALYKETSQALNTQLNLFKSEMKAENLNLFREVSDVTNNLDKLKIELGDHHKLVINNFETVNSTIHEQVNHMSEKIDKRSKTLTVLVIIGILLSAISMILNFIQ